MPKSIAVAIIEDAEGRIALQLRDDHPEVVFAGHWGFFGGKIEADETPSQAVAREIREELTLDVVESDFTFVRNFAEDTERFYHLFFYQAAHKLDSAVLTEGQRIGRFSRTFLLSIEDGWLDGSPLAPPNWFLLREFLSRV